MACWKPSKKPISPCRAGISIDQQRHAHQPVEVSFQREIRLVCRAQVEKRAEADTGCILLVVPKKFVELTEV